MKVAICDDDRAYCKEAQRVLEAYAAERSLDVYVGVFDTVEALLSSGDLASFDLVFMDIEFDGKPLGIEAAKHINQVAPNCRVAYLTDFIQYSVDVYHTEHMWFVVKSQFERRLPEVFEKLARIQTAERSQIIVPLKAGSVVKIACRDILFLERRKRVTYIVTADAAYETPEKLADIVEKLPEAPFAYCHHSYVANMPRIVKICADELVFDAGQKAPVSRRYAKRFRDRYFDWAEQWTV